MIDSLAAILAPTVAALAGPWAPLAARWLLPSPGIPSPANPVSPDPPAGKLSRCAPQAHAGADRIGAVFALAASLAARTEDASPGLGARLARRQAVYEGINIEEEQNRRQRKDVPLRPEESQTTSTFPTKVVGARQTLPVLQPHRPPKVVDRSQANSSPRSRNGS